MVPHMWVAALHRYHLTFQRYVTRVIIVRTNCRDFASDQLPKPGFGSNLFIESLFIYLLYLSTFVGQMEEVGIDIVPSVNLYREKKEKEGGERGNGGGGRKKTLVL